MTTRSTEPTGPSGRPRGRNVLLSILKWLGLSVLALVVLLITFVAGIVAAPAVRAQLAATPPPPAGLDQTLGPLKEAWGLVQDRYVFKDKIDPQQMTYGAIAGMLQTLDDEGHTRFLSPSELKDEESNLSGRFDGIGAEVTTKNGRATIVSPIEGSPAESSGIRAGDVIATVDGQDVSSWTLTDVINHIRGPKGTTVKLQVLHPGDTKVTDLSIVRDEIKVQMASWAMLPGTTIAHIKLSQFGQTVDAELRESLKAAKAAGATGIILDVRNNPGGLLDQAIAVGSEFVDKGVLLQQEDRDGNRKSYEARTGGLGLDLPMVVLTNEGSASASEILAGAMQDNGRAKIVGAKTFGTGTVLSSFELSDGSALLLGTAQWLTPNGRAIRKQGIQPDVAVPQAPDVDLLVPRVEKTMTPDDLKKSPDVQLKRAIEVLDPKQSVETGPEPRGISAIVFPAQ